LKQTHPHLKNTKVVINIFGMQYKPNTLII